MKAAVYEAFEGPITVADIEEPKTRADGVIVKVEANGICRSDWHGWQGHDPLVELPHVPGHELAGVISECGDEVCGWKPGDRVTAPFSCGCGHCGYCRGGQQHICDAPYQPGFSGWGAFAEFVSIPHADVNLIGLPDQVSFVQAASLGCRFATAYRAVVLQGAVRPGEFVAAHGCGGVGLSAIHIAASVGARPIGIDIREPALSLARDLGAEKTINASSVDRVAAAVHEITGGGAHVSIDALGSRLTCVNSVMSLAKQGRHVQVGLMLADERKATIPMARVIAWELSLRGSFGLQAPAYPPLMSMIEGGHIDPGRLVQQEVDLATGATILMGMDTSPPAGVAVITSFG